MGALNVHDIQGNILRAYNFSAGIHYFVRFPDAERGRALLRDLLPEVTPERDWSTRPVIALNVALTYSGLKALEVDQAILDKLPDAFSEPIRERARRELGDNPEEWEPELGRPDTHALVLLASSEEAQAGASLPDRFPQLACAGKWLTALMRDRGATQVLCQHVEALPAYQREHFGFADGLGQPAIEGVADNRPGQGTPDPDPNSDTWYDIQPGEFILGYRDEDGKPLLDEATWLLYDGSYMVYRKLEQDVPAFRRVVSDQAARLNAAWFGSRLNARAAFELMCAKLCGRWRDGQPIELEQGPDRGQDLLQEIATPPENNFRYGNDRAGFRCPAGAHVRRTNPRDLLGRNGQEARRHRIIRRGVPYGPPFEDWDRNGETTPSDDHRKRGLIFICFNGNLERQFEVVQGQWCDNGDDFGLGKAQDFLLGNDIEGQLTIDGDPPFFVRKGEPLVITRGCEYLLMPGLAALERIAAQRVDGMSLERIPPHEPASVHRVTDCVLEEMHRNYAYSRPMRRGQHPKTHACVRAEFIILNPVPADLRFGLFDVEGEQPPYQALIRFSASRSGKLRSDAKADAQGMAIKIIGVDGEKILPRERCLRTQDFILVNHPRFFLRNAKEVAGFARAVTATGSMRSRWYETEFETLAFFLRHRNPRGAQILWNTIRTRPPNPLGLQYWSQTPYAFGPRVVKYSARPDETVGREGVPASDWNGLEEAVKRALAPDTGGDVCFDFLVQPQVDQGTMPIENPVHRWSEDDSRFRKVATIRIPRQELQSQIFAENLSFTPWHALPNHRPLGGINRVRRAVYEASSDMRHDANGVPRSEPGGTIDDCPSRMMDWVKSCLEHGRAPLESKRESQAV